MPTVENSLSILGLIGTALGIVGTLAGLWFGRNHLRRPSMRYAIDEREVVATDDALSRGGLALNFHGVEITRVCRTYFALWVQSGDPVRRDDIPPTSPLIVKLMNDDRVLSARLVSVSNDHIDASIAVSDDNNGVTASFEFLQAGDGFVVEVLHEKHAEPQFEGKILGATLRRQGNVDLTPEARERNRRRFWSRFSSSSQIGLFVSALVAVVTQAVLAVSLVLTSAATETPLFDVSGSSFQSMTGLLFSLAVVMAVACIVISGGILARVRRRIPASVVAIDRQEALEWISNATYPGGETPVRIGDTIRHRDFGDGEIIALQGHGNKLIIKVSFSNGDEKKLLVKVAPIELVRAAATPTAGSADFMTLGEIKIRR